MSHFRSLPLLTSHSRPAANNGRSRDEYNENYGGARRIPKFMNKFLLHSSRFYTHTQSKADRANKGRIKEILVGRSVLIGMPNVMPYSPQKEGEKRKIFSSFGFPHFAGCHRIVFCMTKDSDEKPFTFHPSSSYSIFLSPFLGKQKQQRSSNSNGGAKGVLRTERIRLFLFVDKGNRGFSA